MSRTRATRAAAIAWSGSALGLGTCALGAELAAGPGERMAVATLGLELFLGFGAIGAAALSREPLAERLGLSPGTLPWRLLALAVLGTLALSHALDTLLSSTGLRDESALARIDALLAGADARTLMLALLCLGLAPALGEELLCRGWLQRGLTARLGPGAGIAMASLVFGVLHLELAQGGAAFALGLYLGGVAHLSGGIRAPVLCHAVNNLTAMALSASDLGGEVAARPELSAAPAPTALIGAGIALSGAILWLLWRRSPPAPPPTPARTIGLQPEAGSDEG